MKAVARYRNTLWRQEAIRAGRVLAERHAQELAHIAIIRIDLSGVIASRRPYYKLRWGGRSEC